MATKKSGRKKARTPAQKRATAKLVKLNKSRKRSSSPKRRKTTTRVKKRKSSSKPMAKRKTTRRSSGGKGILGKIPLISNPTFKKAAAGVGTATLGVAALSLVAPQIAANPIIKPVLALAGGDIAGLAAQVLSGGGIGLGGGNGNAGMEGFG